MNMLFTILNVMHQVIIPEPSLLNFPNRWTIHLRINYPMEGAVIILFIEWTKILECPGLTSLYYGVNKYRR